MPSTTAYVPQCTAQQKNKIPRYGKSLTKCSHTSVQSYAVTKYLIVLLNDFQTSAPPRSILVFMFMPQLSQCLAVLGMKLIDCCDEVWVHGRSFALPLGYLMKYQEII
jgi:hypothetical protein